MGPRFAAAVDQDVLIILLDDFHVIARNAGIADFQIVITVTADPKRSLANAMGMKEIARLVDSDFREIALSHDVIAPFDFLLNVPTELIFQRCPASIGPGPGFPTIRSEQKKYHLPHRLRS